MKVGDKVLINRSRIEQDNNLHGTIEEIELFEGDLEIWIRVGTRLVLCHEGEFDVLG